MQINEQLSPCSTIIMNWCHLLAGIDVQERTSSPETEVSELSEKPELHSPESRRLRAGCWRDRPELVASLWCDPFLCMCLRVVRSDQAPSKSEIRPFLLLTLMSVVLKCNVLPVKALQFISPWAGVCASTHTGLAVHQIQSDLKNSAKYCFLHLHD